MAMVPDKDTAAMFEAEVEHGATGHVIILNFSSQLQLSYILKCVQCYIIDMNTICVCNT